ncbi:hypothetical protein ACFQY7_06810 [Actinomadura luteofluorescens]|uniref:hypothetical protein n=1 Tax=Actinomadura luteofluorescens TaxID=46163 RepID=UPI003644C31A
MEGRFERLREDGVDLGELRDEGRGRPAAGRPGGEPEQQEGGGLDVRDVADRQPRRRAERGPGERLGRPERLHVPEAVQLDAPAVPEHGVRGDGPVREAEVGEERERAEQVARRPAELHVVEPRHRFAPGDGHAAAGHHEAYGPLRRLEADHPPGGRLPPADPVVDLGLAAQQLRPGGREGGLEKGVAVVGATVAVAEERVLVLQPAPRESDRDPTGLPER